MSSIMEQVDCISNDILQKMSEVKEGSDAHKFLLIKKKILEDSLLQIQKIIDNAQINKYEYELYVLFEQCENLRYKISMKERRPTDDDEDMKALKEAHGQMTWIQATKLKGVKLTEMPKKLTNPRF
jgi:hypothetical protein